MKRLSCIILFIAILLTSIPLFAISSSALLEYEVTRNPDYIYKDYVDEIYDQIFDFDSFEDYSDAYGTKSRVVIDVSSWNMDTSVVSQMCLSMHRQYPEMFFLSGRFAFSRTSSNKVVALHIYSEYYKDDLPTMMQQVESETLSILNEASKIPTDEGKVLYIHNYLTLNTRYNEDVLNGGSGTTSVYNIYGALVEHDAVCQGYAYAFNYLVQRLGIMSDFVRSGEMVHGWSIVKLGDYWYHIDPTFDDPAYDFVGYMRYSYFLRSEEGILSEGHKDITSISSENATTTTYTTGTKYDNLFMQDQEQYFGNIAYCDGNWYFIKRDASYSSSKFSICVTSDPFVSESELEYSVMQTNSCYWRVNETQVLKFTYPGLSTYNGRIYYSTASGIYSCTPDGTDDQTVLEPERPNVYTNVYGITIRNGYVYYNFESERVSVTSHPEIKSFKLPDTPCASKLTPVDGFVYSTDGVYVWDIPEGTTAEYIMNSFVEESYITDSNGNVISSADPVGTGYVIYTADDNGLATTYYILIVSGDLDGDACVSGKDLIRIRKYITNNEAVIPYVRSADLDGDGEITESDLSMIVNMIMDK